MVCVNPNVCLKLPGVKKAELVRENSILSRRQIDLYNP